MKRHIFIAVLAILAAAASVAAKRPESRWAAFEGNKIHYYDIGADKRNAIVFIHGWTCNADFWKDSHSAFPGRHVIALDLIGHGKSDKPQAAYSMEYFARSVEAVMKHARVQKAVLVGHSMGTPVAREFYRLFPEKTLGIVIVDGAVKPFAPKAAMLEFIKPLREDYKKNAAKFVDGMLEPIKDEALKRYIREGMAATPPHVAISAWEGMADEKIWVNDEIGVPVLAVLAKSPFWPPEPQKMYEAVAPELEFHMWNDASHFLMMEKPKEFNELIRAFVAKHKLL